ncbi:MAG: DUF3604 domain-containing protein [Halioglobus sp.]
MIDRSVKKSAGLVARFFAPGLFVFLLSVTGGCSRPFDDTGEVTTISAPRASEARSRPYGISADRPQKQILFGDLHGHTSFSLDAYEKGMSIVNGEGLRPPGDACDFARYCSGLDFWSITDHAEFLNQERWSGIRDTVKQCNAIAGDTESPDMVTFLGWEWTQIGSRPAVHYGHKNIILRDVDASLTPSHAVAATGESRFNVKLPTGATLRERLMRLFHDPGNFREHLNYLRFSASGLSDPACESDTSGLILDDACKAYAASPAELYRQLEAIGSEYIAIPHGNSWGLYTPPGSDWRKQLRGDDRMPGRQTLLEVYSGHGNSEQYRAWRASQVEDGNEASCPEPQDDYLPCCWRAGEIIQQRCTDAHSPQCMQDVIRARQNYVDAGSSGHLTLTGVEEKEWLNCGQCTDCFLPAFNFRPGTSAQAALAVREGGERFRFGLIGSSDNHSARPGTGYKEYARLPMTDGRGPSDAWQTIRPRLQSASVGTRSPGEIAASPENVYERSRVSSFYTTGGLVAVHSQGRNRAAIWDALKAKEVYGTSGPRMLLWFDLLDEKIGALPMGSESLRDTAPRFKIHAYGALQQRPGCPDSSVRALGPERLASLCRNECYLPGSERHRIQRLEVVRIRPQLHSEEPLESLVEDPWRVFSCDDQGEGCGAEFSDPEFPARKRDAVYYVRAVQVPTPTINGDGLRCEYDAEGRCIAVNPCYADSRTDPDDDCLAPVEHRAWSSPIFVDYLGAVQSAGSETH